MATSPGPIRRLWYNWKMMRLPWRRKWLVGFDLEGNTFWEFKDALNAGRYRRIVQYSRWTHHGDVNVPPQWVQWLRHTRYEPPSIAEQRADVVRQERIKFLAAQADTRWAEKPSALDAPEKQQPMQTLNSRVPDTGARQLNRDRQFRGRPQPLHTKEELNSTPEQLEQTEAAMPTKVNKKTKETTSSSWQQPAKGNSPSQWQPQSWSPASVKRRV